MILRQTRRPAGPCLAFTMVSMAALLLSAGVTRAETAPDHICEGGAYVWTGAGGRSWSDPANWDGTDPAGDPVGGYPGADARDCAFIGKQGAGSPVIDGAADITADSIYVASGGDDGALDILDGRVTVRAPAGSESGGHIVLGRDGGAGLLTIGGAGAPHVETGQLEVNTAGDRLRVLSGTLNVTDTAFLSAGTTEILGSGLLRAGWLDVENDAALRVQGGTVEVADTALLTGGTTQILDGGRLRAAWLEVGNGANVIIDTQAPGTGIETGDFLISGAQGAFAIRNGVLSATAASDDFPYIEDRRVVVGGADGQALLRVDASSAPGGSGRGGLAIGGSGSVEVLRNGLLEVGKVQLFDAASLVFDGGHDGKVFDAAIAGTGSLALRQGALTLTADNTYTGATHIGGALTLAGKGSLGTGVVVVHGSLRFDREEPLVFANGLAGSGTIVHSRGDTTFTGSGAYAGTAVIDAGRVTVLGDLPQASVLLNSGLLRANGRLHHVTVNAGSVLEGAASTPDQVNIGTLVVNGGIVHPGNSPGTLRVGSYTQAGGTIVFERGDLIEVVGGGQAVLSRGTDGSPVVIRLAESADSYVYGNLYAFVKAEGGVTFTTPDAVVIEEKPRLFTRFETGAVDREGHFYLVRDRSLASADLGPGEQGVARALEATSPDGRSLGSAAYNRIVSAEADQLPAVNRALRQLTGELHATVQGRLVDDSRHVRDALATRTRSALSGERGAAAGQSVRQPGGGLGLWGQAYGARGHAGTTAATAGVTHSTGGFVLGADTPVGADWRVGIAGGYGRSEVRLGAQLGSATMDNYNAALYAGGQWGAFGLRLGVANTWHRIAARRDLAVAELGLFDQRRADYDARSMQFFGEAGYGIAVGTATVEPFVNLAYVDYRSDSFREHDTGLGTGLLSRAGHRQTGFSTLGARLSTDIDAGGAKGAISGTLGWRHAFGDVRPGNVFAFDPQATFLTGGAPILRNALVAGVAVEAQIAEGASVAVSYTGQVGRRAHDHGIKAALSVSLN